MLALSATDPPSSGVLKVAFDATNDVVDLSTGTLDVYFSGGSRSQQLYFVLYMGASACKSAAGSRLLSLLGWLALPDSQIL